MFEIRQPCNSRCLVAVAFCGSGDVPHHGTEDNCVEGDDCPPVQVSEQTERAVCRALTVHGAAAVVVIDDEFEPREARQLHLGTQPKQRTTITTFHAPEVHALPDVEMSRIATTASQPDSADHPIEQAADLPEKQRRVVAVLATDTFDDVP